MRLSIRTRFTLALVAFTACVLVATLFLARWSFLSGFADFIHGVEENRLRHVAARLGALYAATDSWPPDIAERFGGLSREPFGTAGSRTAPALPPPRGPRARNRSGPHPTGLYDPEGALIAGSNLDAVDERRVTAPVVVADTVVGIVQSAPRTGVGQPLAAAFAARHLESMIVVGLVALLVAIVLSMLLSRLLLNPLGRLLDGISQLSSGNYDVELASTRRDKVGVLMHDFDRLAETLRETRRARRRMFADISHELRTPLSILAAEIEALSDGVRAPTPAAITSLGHEVERLSYLVDDLYALSTSDAGALTYSFELRDVAALVGEVIETLPPDATHGLVITPRLDRAMAHVDPRRMVQLVRNVLMNAARYTDRPGRIEVDLTSGADGVVLSIADTAPSVPYDACERLFQPMYRRDSSRSRQAAGAGLGLAICRSIAEAHQGTITAEPAAIGGLCVTTTLPAR